MSDLDQIIDSEAGSTQDGQTAYFHAPWYGDLKACTACTCRPEAKQVVPGVGPRDAEFLILGRNPGKNEDKDGIPLIGRSGEELNDWLLKLGLDRSKLAISNLVKCHTEKDRMPKRPEIETCTGLWLRKEIDYLHKLRVIIPLGVEATLFLLGDRGASPGKLQAYAEQIEINGRRLHVLPIAHPSYLLRSRGKAQLLYNAVLPKVREYLRREVPDAYERAALKSGSAA